MHDIIPLINISHIANPLEFVHGTPLQTNFLLALQDYCLSPLDPFSVIIG